MDVPREILHFPLTPRLCSSCKEDLPIDDFIGLCMGTCFGKFHFSCIPLKDEEKTALKETIGQKNVRFLCPSCEETRLDPGSRLPPEIMTMVFSYLNIKDLGSCSLVCSQWRTLSGTDSVWRRKCNENSVLGDTKVTLEDDSTLPPLGQKALFYREAMKRLRSNLLENHSREHILRDVVLQWNCDGRILVMKVENEDGYLVYDLAYDCPKKIQVLTVDDPHFNFKVMSQMIVFHTPTGFTLFKRSDVYKRSFSWEFDITKPHPYNGCIPDRASMNRIVSTQSYLYCQVNCSTTVKVALVEEVFIWCLNTDTLLKRIIIPKLSEVIWSSLNVCIIDGSHLSQWKRAMVLDGNKHLTAQYTHRVEGFSSSKSFIAFNFSNYAVHVYDMAGVLHFKYKGADVKLMIVLNDGSVLYNSEIELVYNSSCGFVQKMDNDSKVHESQVFNGKYLWTSTHFTILLYDLSEGILMHKLRKAWKWGKCNLSSDTLIMVYNTKRDFEVLNHLKLLCFRDVGF